MLARSVLLVMGFIMTLPLRGGIIVSQHTGDADPATEGWTPQEFGSGVTTGPVIADGMFDAWSVNDQGTSGGRAYRSILSSVDAQKALNGGFVQRARLRVVNPSTLPDGVVAVEFLTSSIAFLLSIGSEADGDPILWLQNDSGATALTAQGAGGGYHLYELIYDPATQLADVRLDGQHLADYPGFHPVILAINPPPRDVRWGSISGDGTGAANYNLVQMELVPEPTALALLAPAAITLRLRRCRRASR
jgi:hypothetical protein